MDWQPAASLEHLRARAALLQQVRRFFAEREILEVETPLLCRSGVTDPAIEPLLVERGALLRQTRYLQTSPEYAMKRLLTRDHLPIYQITRYPLHRITGKRDDRLISLLRFKIRNGV